MLRHKPLHLIQDIIQLWVLAQESDGHRSRITLFIFIPATATVAQEAAIRYWTKSNSELEEYELDGTRGYFWTAQVKPDAAKGLIKDLVAAGGGLFNKYPY